ncbi:hypothetical protein SAMN05421837_101134 [Amycolatopsis pretoriensis]|uniref:Uncharacterized protein n=1 Tax=Amycolatopsis pretoriensis TaxID=218821 RepID=A0A1H5Q1Q6_9PSEU|nr:hypothetical protein [Amycolatopsis pretoriensis]SEF19869.1 hypothetical protein SAMN05421837_101134 [Amycolatopsis pretoriensis]
MRLAGVRWRASVGTARLDGVDHRVVRPRRPIRDAVLEEDRFGAQFAVGKDAAVDFAAAWWLAARSPHSLVHLPLRAPASAGRPLDLVLLHHRLGFRVSSWKGLRARLSPPAATTVTLPPRPFPLFDRADHERFFHRDFRDHLRYSFAADTLFVIGSRRAFELAGEEVRSLVEDGPAQLAAGVHWCAEIGLGPWKQHHRRNPAALLHVYHRDPR